MSISHFLHFCFGFLFCPFNFLIIFLSSKCEYGFLCLSLNLDVVCPNLGIVTLIVVGGLKNIFFHCKYVCGSFFYKFLALRFDCSPFLRFLTNIIVVMGGVTTWKLGCD
ncbi:hypothetical protein I3843_11G105700 [Carya illinoinensis]|nr:hypothetical protein I3760_11G104500 [Carya illinoinensis]KAG7956061.1 hypothetical protein I3843_11G105700 [Carya illinoinensis]